MTDISISQFLCVCGIPHVIAKGIGNETGALWSSDLHLYGVLKHSIHLIATANLVTA